MSVEGGRGGAPTLVCGCICPLLLGGEKREGDSGMTEGGWGVVGSCWAQGIWSPGVSGVSSEGVGLDSSETDARGAAGVGLTFASWRACGRVSGKVGGEKGGRSRGEREERGAAPSLVGPWRGGGGAASALDVRTGVDVLIRLGVDSAGSTGAGEGTQRRGELEKEGGAVNRETLLSLLPAWELLP